MSKAHHGRCLEDPVSADLAVLVISCDKYKDAWAPCFELLFKLWPECGYPVYLGTNHLDFEHPRVATLRIGDDLSWADSVRKMVEAIPERHIMMMFEDFFLGSRIKPGIIEGMLKDMDRETAAYLKVYAPIPISKRRYPGDSKYYLIAPDDPYCVSTGLSIWEKRTLLDLLLPGYSAWDFEVKNSESCRRAQRMPGLFLSRRKTDIVILNGIWKGKWVPATVRKCRRLGIAWDTSSRPLMSANEVVWDSAKTLGKRWLPRSIGKIGKALLFRMGFGNRFVSPV